MTDSIAPSPTPEQPDRGAAVTADVAPFSVDELRRSLRDPQRLLTVVLAERSRLVASLRAPEALPWLLLVLYLCGVLCTLPFSLVMDRTKVAHVAVLFSGSVLICFPALQVFGAYLGGKLTIAQNLALALVVPAAAALFCFGFFPIQWFLAATMPKEHAVVSARDLAIGLLTVSLALGLGHLNRCVLLGGALRELRSNWLLLLGWQALLVFITWRMAQALGILG
jgi:hypothetical protein